MIYNNKNDLPSELNNSDISR